MREFMALFRLSGRPGRFAVLTLCRFPFDMIRTVLQAAFMQMTFDAIAQGSAPSLHIACLVYGLGNLLLFVYNGSVWTGYAMVHTQWISAIRCRMFAHLSALSLKQIEAKPSGDWVVNLNADISAATAIMGHPHQLHHAGASALNILISSAVLIWMSPQMYGLILLFVVPHLLLTQVITKPMGYLAGEAKKAAARNATNMNAIITCADTAMLYDAQPLLLSKFEQSSLALRRTNMRMSGQKALLGGLLPLLGMAGYMAVLAVGGNMIAQGHMTFGGLTAIFQYRGGVMVGMMNLSACLVNIKIALASIKRVNETLHLPLEE